MNALSRNRLTPKQREEANNIASTYIIKKQSEIEEKCKDQILFMVEVATHIVLEEQLGFGDIRRQRIMKAIGSKMNEIGDLLLGNTCDEGNGEVYDIDMNRTILQRYADIYGIQYDESIFD